MPSVRVFTSWNTGLSMWKRVCLQDTRIVDADSSRLVIVTWMSARFHLIDAQAIELIRDPLQFSMGKSLFILMRHERGHWRINNRRGKARTRNFEASGLRHFGLSHIILSVQSVKAVIDGISIRHHIVETCFTKHWASRCQKFVDRISMVWKIRESDYGYSCPL